MSKIKILHNHPLPSNTFRDRLLSLLDYMASQKDTSLERINTRIRDLIVSHKTESPNFKMELYYIVLYQGELTIRFGHEGESNIILKEA